VRLIELVFAASIALSAMALIESSPASAQVASSKPLTCTPFEVNFNNDGSTSVDSAYPIDTVFNACLENWATGHICNYSIEYGNFGKPFAKAILNSGTCWVAVGDDINFINLTWSDGAGSKLVGTPNVWNTWEQVNGPSGDDVSTTTFYICVDGVQSCLGLGLEPPI